MLVCSSLGQFTVVFFLVLLSESNVCLQIVFKYYSREINFIKRSMITTTMHNPTLFEDTNNYDIVLNLDSLRKKEKSRKKKYFDILYTNRQ